MGARPDEGDAPGRVRRAARALWRHPAAVLGTLVAAASGLAFQGAGLVMDDTGYLERYLPTLQSWEEAFLLPAGFRSWIGPLQRPLSMLSFQLDRWLWGSGGVRGFHWSQAAYYGAAVASFVLLAAALLRALAPRLAEEVRRRATWVAGVLFAIHPLHVETAAWLSTRSDVLFAALLLLGLRASAAAAEARRLSVLWRWSVVAAALGGLSVQAKEAGFAFFPLQVALVLLLSRPEGGMRRLAPVLLCSAVALLACLAARVLEALPSPGPWYPDWLGRWLSALGWALTSTALPVAPRLLYEPPPPPGWSALAAAAAAAWLWWGIRSLRRGHGLPLYGFLLCVTTLAPTWMVAWRGVMLSVVGDRYLLLPVGGALLAAAACFSRGPRGGAAAALWAAWLALVAVRYAAVWAGPPQALATWTVEHAPRSFGARMGGVIRALRASDVPLARSLLDREPPPEPRASEAHNVEALRAAVLFYEGRYEEAIESAWQAVNIAPRQPRCWQELGVLVYEVFREEMDEPQEDPQVLPKLLGDARHALTRAIELDDRSYQAWFTLGRLRASMGDFGAARQAYERAAELAPGTDTARLARLRARLLPDPQRWDWGEELARARAEIGGGDSAERWLELGLVLYDSFLDAAHLLGGGGPRPPAEEARRAFERALALDPALLGARLHLGLVCGKLGDWAAARAAFERVLAEAPGSLEARDARVNLGRLPR